MDVQVLHAHTPGRADRVRDEPLPDAQPPDVGCHTDVGYVGAGRDGGKGEGDGVKAFEQLAGQLGCDVEVERAYEKAVRGMKVLCLKGG